MAMSFSDILKSASFLSNNEMATFLKQTKMKPQQTYEGLRIIV